MNNALRFCILSLLGAVLLALPTLAQSNPVPFINNPLVPASAAPGGNGFTLTINGDGFVSASQVEWRGVPLITAVTSGTKLSAQVPASKIARVGTASITVVNPGAPSSNVLFFPVAAPESVVAFARTDMTDPTPATVIAGDFNNDGKPDLMVGDANGVSVYLGKGNGTFKAPLMTSADGAYLLVDGDFNGDGKQDFVSYGYVYFGNGDGTFTKGPSFGSSIESGLVVGDFNADGKLDLLEFTTDFGSSAAQMFLGNGDGTFQVTGSPFAVNAVTATVGDFNNDGRLDLAVPDYSSGNIAIFLGNGDGTFQPPAYTNTPSFSEKLTAADLNGDGNLDLVVPGYSSSVAILLGNGDGTFKSYVNYTTAAGATQAVSADFNGDGKLDLAVLCNDSETEPGFVSVLPGNGDGTFQAHVDFDTGIYPDGIDFADFNNDGRMDLAVGNSVSNTLSIFLQSQVSLSPPSLTFAAQNVGSSSPAQPVTLTNSGSTALTISSITFTGADPLDFAETNTCGGTVAAGSSCTINVVFDPTATGTRTATLNVNDNGAGSPQTVSLTGTGTQAVVMLSATALTFPTQLVNTTSAAQQVTLTNTGTGTLNISSIAATGDFLQSNTCGTSVPVNGSCVISVQFMPTGKGTRTGSVTITDDGVGSPQVISLTGVGTFVEFSVIGVNFGNQKVGTTSPAAIVTLTNTSGNALLITSISIMGADPSDFGETNNCAASLPAKSSCKIRVTFTPTMKGARSAKLAASDNGGGSPQTVPLSGSGT